MTESDRLLQPPRPGRVARTLLGWLMRPAGVVAAESLSARFRLIDLAGDALKTVAWAPGHKIQVAMGSGLATRTYTPMSWDAETGGTRILAFAHGEGPGARWSADVAVGDACQFFGPRRSLDLAGLPAPVVLFGDETSFGLAAALRAAPHGARAICLFEASDAAEARPVLAAIGLGHANAFQRLPGDAHLTVVDGELAQFAAAGGSFVLTGKASSVQHVGQALKALGVGSARIRAKAYWAPGKTGLD